MSRDYNVIQLLKVQIYLVNCLLWNLQNIIGVAHVLRVKVFRIDCHTNKIYSLMKFYKLKFPKDNENSR